MQLKGNVRERRRGNEETDIIAGNLGGIAYAVFLLIQDRSDETASGTDRSEENFQKGGIQSESQRRCGEEKQQIQSGERKGGKGTQPGHKPEREQEKQSAR